MTPSAAAGLKLSTSSFMYSSVWPSRCKWSAKRLMGMLVSVYRLVNSMPYAPPGCSGAG